MGSKGHSTLCLAAGLFFVCGILGIIAVSSAWWTGNDGKTEFSLWKMKFEYGADNEILATHDDMCKNSAGALATYCSKINATRAMAIMTAIFGAVQAIFLLCEFCKHRIWLLITCLVVGLVCPGCAIAALALGLQLVADNSLITDPGAGFICVCIAAAFSGVAYVLSCVGACMGPKGASGNCCDCSGSTGGSAYGGHQRFRDRPPVSARAPVAGLFAQPPMRPPMQPPPVQVPRPAPAQNINLTIRAVAPPAPVAYNSQPPPVVYQAPPPSGGNDDFGINRH